MAVLAIYRAGKALHNGERILGEHKTGADDPGFTYESGASVS